MRIAISPWLNPERMCATSISRVRRWNVRSRITRRPMTQSSFSCTKCSDCGGRARIDLLHGPFVNDDKQRDAGLLYAPWLMAHAATLQARARRRSAMPFR